MLCIMYILNKFSKWFQTIVSGQKKKKKTLRTYLVHTTNILQMQNDKKENNFISNLQIEQRFAQLLFSNHSNMGKSVFFFLSAKLFKTCMSRKQNKQFFCLNRHSSLVVVVVVAFCLIGVENLYRVYQCSHKSEAKQSDLYPFNFY